MKIALIDSGIGGLTLLKRLLKSFPKADYIYFADTYAHPYGSKDADFLRFRLLKIVELLYERRADIVVFACNTASSVMLQGEHDFPLPVLGVSPKVNEPQGTLIACTPLTACSPKVKEYAEKGACVYANPCLATLVERYVRNLSRLENYLYLELSRYDVERVVLGCTHYVYLKDIVAKVTGAKVDDCFTPVVNELQKFAPNGGSGKLDFIFTAQNERKYYLELLERACF
ncbi:MAG: aspartate/glutamate racemase family protein [Clostridia bacterium]|nr:aspartate/glutamate racemase family protein [Clostridia bacterium]